MQGETAQGLVTSWIDELSGKVSISASTVQDHLIDLWGLLDDGEIRGEVERWLTETLQRELYIVDDVVERLREMLEAERVA